MTVDREVHFHVASSSRVPPRHTAGHNWRVTITLSEIEEAGTDACKVVRSGKANLGIAVLLYNLCIIRTQFKLNFEVVLCVSRALQWTKDLVADILVVMNLNVVVVVLVVVNRNSNSEGVISDGTAHI